MANYRIEELSHSNENEWEEFNKKTDGGSFFHTLKWKNVIENSFDYKLHYYLIYFDDRVIAICPFCENTIKGYRGLMPPPNSDYRHLLLSKQDYEHLEEILSKIIKISRSNKFSFILITTLSQVIKDYLKKYNPLPYPIFGGSGNFVLNLQINNPEKIWHDIFRNKTRNTIRKFEKDGFKIREATSIDDLKLFYKYYRMNLEYKKRKPYPFSHFERIWDTCASTDLRLTLLHRGENVHGGLLAFMYPPTKTMYLRYLAIDRDIRARYKVADYVHWECVQFASNQKFNSISFGETPWDPNDETFKFKKSFGCFFENMYSFILPFSFTFRLGYNVYKYFNIPQQIKKNNE